MYTFISYGAGIVVLLWALVGDFSHNVVRPRDTGRRVLYYAGLLSYVVPNLLFYSMMTHWFTGFSATGEPSKDTVDILDQAIPAARPLIIALGYVYASSFSVFQVRGKTISVRDKLLSILKPWFKLNLKEVSLIRTTFEMQGFLRADVEKTKILWNAFATKLAHVEETRSWKIDTLQKKRMKDDYDSLSNQIVQLEDIGGVIESLSITKSDAEAIWEKLHQAEKSIRERLNEMFVLFFETIIRDNVRDEAKIDEIMKFFGFGKMTAQEESDTQLDIAYILMICFFGGIAFTLIVILTNDTTLDPLYLFPASWIAIAVFLVLMDFGGRRAGMIGKSRKAPARKCTVCLFFSGFAGGIIGLYILLLVEGISGLIEKGATPEELFELLSASFTNKDLWQGGVFGGFSGLLVFCTDWLFHRSKVLSRHVGLRALSSIMLGAGVFALIQVCWLALKEEAEIQLALVIQAAGIGALILPLIVLVFGLLEMTDLQPHDQEEART